MPETPSRPREEPAIPPAAEAPVNQPPPAAAVVRRASMGRSRATGLVGLVLGALVGVIFTLSPWICGVIGFIVFAELPDLVYRLRAKRGLTGSLLPAWSASEAYLVTLRRWRRSRLDPPA